MCMSTISLDAVRLLLNVCSPDQDAISPCRITAMVKNFSQFVIVDQSIVIEPLATLLPYPSCVYHFP